jgi:hypothetical protein
MWCTTFEKGSIISAWGCQGRGNVIPILTDKSRIGITYLVPLLFGKLPSVDGLCGTDTAQLKGPVLPLLKFPALLNSLHYSILESIQTRASNGQGFWLRQSGSLGQWKLMLCFSQPLVCDFKKFSVLFKKSWSTRTPATLADDLPRPYFQLQQYSIL